MKHARGNYPMLIYGNYRNNAKLVRITKYLKKMDILLAILLIIVGEIIQELSII